MTTTPRQATKLTFGEGSPISLDWKTLPEGMAKYQAYLCSREWAKLKRAVHERSGGICERCEDNPGENVHHLTYEHKYAEQIDEVAHWCKGCHEFTHGKSDVDPVGLKRSRETESFAADKPMSDCMFRERSRHHKRLGASILACPYPGCTCEGVHFGDPVKQFSKDLVLIIIPMWCEDNHEWDVCFEQFRGTVAAYTKNHQEAVGYD